MIFTVILFFFSLVVLLVASDYFVDSAERIGLGLGIPSFIIGVTIVAFGTSLPELATSIASVLSGSSEIVIGNVVGSNITNILLVIGLTAIAGRGIDIDYDIINTDIPMLIGSVFLLFFTINDLHFTMIEAILLSMALIVFLFNSFKDNGEEKGEKSRIRPVDWLIVVVAAVFVYLGAKYTIDALQKIAEEMMIPTHIISITVVAFGTSLPEIIVSINAAKKGKHAMAVGNVLGSNIFNTYGVMGISRFFGDLTIPDETIVFSTPFMMAITLLFGIVCLSRKISIWEGYMLVITYLFFLSVLVDTMGL